MRAVLRGVFVLAGILLLYIGNGIHKNKDASALTKWKEMVSVELQIVELDRNNTHLVEEVASLRKR